MTDRDVTQRTRDLIAQISPGCSGPYGRGSMSCAVYDTAWVSLVTRNDQDSKAYLFPECFEYVLSQQNDDGSWPSYSSHIDGILNTAAALLALKTHASTAPRKGSLNLDTRISKAQDALQHLLDEWQVEGTVHVGFEILVPALLDYLAAEDLTFDFPGKSTLYAIRTKKMSKLKPEYLYLPKQITALHSLEAFIGLIDFDKVRHHKIDGSFMASPSSTAAFLMNASQWDEDCENYLRHALRDGAGQGKGGIPSAFPSPVFETTWVLSTLADAGIDLLELAPDDINASLNYLAESFERGNGLLGFTPSVGADADDTAKAILTMNLLGKPTSAESLLNEFEDAKHFKTYQMERDPSFSANCNVLNALLHAPNVSRYAPQLEKALTFLCSAFQASNMAVKDKWNLSQLYPAMLMVQACAKYSALVETGELLSLENFSFFDDAVPILQRLIHSVLSTQNVDGSWGSKCRVEQTAYAVLALAHGVQIPDIAHLVLESQSRIRLGQGYLRRTPPSGTQHLWIEKVSYGSRLLCESYVLAALSIDFSRRDTSDRRVKTSTRTNSSDSGYDSEDSFKDEESHNDRGGESREEESSEPRPQGSLTADNMPMMNNDNWREWTVNELCTLTKPFDYLDAQPGKDIRTQLLRAFNNWLHISESKFTTIAKIIRRLHNASLMVDDIEDSSLLRRGRPAAHHVFGTPETLNSANYAYFQALADVHSLNNPRALTVFVTEMLNLHRGQGLDLHWRDNLICPSEDAYLRMVSGKTGGLFRLAIGLMQAESTSYIGDCMPLVDALGTIFQLRDDYINLRSTTYAQTKGTCEDLEEGKFSFPILHSIRSSGPEDHELLDILRSRTHDEVVKQRAMRIMERTGSFAYTRELVRRLTGRAFELIDRMEREEEGGGGRGMPGAGDGVRKIICLMALEDG